MGIVNNLLIGFIASFVGVVLPGLLNLSAAKIRVQEGASRAYLFSIGVVPIVVTQTAIGLLLAGYLNKQPDLMLLLKRIAVTVFFILSVYYLFLAKDTRLNVSKESNNSHSNRFFLGMLLAALNLFPIPFWVYIGVSFSEIGWLQLSSWPFIVTIIASGLGTLATLSLYIKYFNEKRSSYMKKINLNWLIGGVTGIVAIITLVGLLR